MKFWSIIILALVLFSTGSVAKEQVEVTEAPLTWQQAALTDGEELYMELCAVCHGTSGKGDGPAASALVKPATDLTVIAANNDGEFPRDAVIKSIAGETRVTAHGTAEMPVWGARFEELRPDWQHYRRKALARQRIYNLTLHIESLQVE